MNKEQRPEKLEPTFQDIREGTTFTTQMKGKPPECARLVNLNLDTGRVLFENCEDRRPFSSSLMGLMNGRVGRSVITGIQAQEQPAVKPSEDRSENFDKPTVLIFPKQDYDPKNPKPVRTIMTREEDGRIILGLESNPEAAVFYVMPTALLAEEDEDNLYKINYRYDVKPGEELPIPLESSPNTQKVDGNIDEARLAPLTEGEIQNMEAFVKTHPLLPVRIHGLNAEPIFPGQRCQILKRLGESVRNVINFPAIYMGTFIKGGNKFARFFRVRQQDGGGKAESLIEAEDISTENLGKRSGRYIGILKDPFTITS